MRKLWLIAILFCLSVPALAATTYFACASANVDAALEWDATSAACGAKVTPTFAAGDTLVANSFTVALNVNPAAGGVTLRNDNFSGATAGGQFTCATATGPATINANVIAGSTATAGLAISGSSATPGCNLVGNGTAGTSGSGHAVSDSHTVGALAHEGTFTGNGGGGYVFTGATGSVQITGKCIGSDAGNSAGCLASGAGAIKVIGPIISGKRALGAGGTILYTPAATDCVMLMGASAWATTPSACTATDATHQQMPSDTNIATQARVIAPYTYGSYTGTGTSGGNSGSAH